jgi:hypothetical protein
VVETLLDLGALKVGTECAGNGGDALDNGTHVTQDERLPVGTKAKFNLERSGLTRQATTPIMDCYKNANWFY